MFIEYVKIVDRFKVMTLVQRIPTYCFLKLKMKSHSEESSRTKEKGEGVDPFFQF